MKSTILSFIFLLIASTFVAAGPIAAIARVGMSVASKVIPKIAKGASKAANVADKANSANNAVQSAKQKKGKRSFDDEELMEALVTRDHSVQEWIDLTYNPYAGDGISREILGMMAKLGRTPPPPGASCPTRTKHVPQFSHKLAINEAVPIPREDAVRALNLMLAEPDPSKKLFFAALEVAMQLNCWTVPADIKAVVDAKGWMQSAGAAPVAQAPSASPAATGPAPRSIEDEEFDLFGRDIFDDFEFTDLFSREAEADPEADEDIELWTREAEAEAEPMAYFDDDSYFYERNFQ